MRLANALFFNPLNPKPMNKLERYLDAIMLVVTYIGGIGVCLCILRWLIHYLTL